MLSFVAAKMILCFHMAPELAFQIKSDINLLGSDKSSGLTLPSIKNQAKCYNIDYLKIDKTKNLEIKIKEVLNNKKATICEVIIRQDQKTEPKVKAFQKEDGSFDIMPMENL